MNLPSPATTHQQAILQHIAYTRLANRTQLAKILGTSNESIASTMRDGKFVERGILAVVPSRRYYQAHQWQGRGSITYRLTAEGASYLKKEYGINATHSRSFKVAEITHALCQADVWIQLRLLGYSVEREHTLKDRQAEIRPDNYVTEGSRFVIVETEQNILQNRLTAKVNNLFKYFLQVPLDSTLDKRIRIVYTWLGPLEGEPSAAHQNAMRMWNWALKDAQKRFKCSKVPFEVGFLSHEEFLKTPTIDWSAYAPLQVKFVPPAEKYISTPFPDIPDVVSIVNCFKNFKEAFEHVNTMQQQYALVALLMDWLREQPALLERLQDAQPEKGNIRERLGRVGVALLAWLDCPAYPFEAGSVAHVQVLPDGEGQLYLRITLNPLQLNMVLRTIIDEVYAGNMNKLVNTLQLLTNLFTHHAHELHLKSRYDEARHTPQFPLSSPPAKGDPENDFEQKIEETTWAEEAETVSTTEIIDNPWDEIDWGLGDNSTPDHSGKAI